MSTTPTTVRLPGDALGAAREILNYFPEVPVEPQLTHVRSDLEAVRAAAPGETDMHTDYCILRLLIDLSDGGFLTGRTPRFVWGVRASAPPEVPDQ